MSNFIYNNTDNYTITWGGSNLTADQISSFTGKTNVNISSESGVYGTVRFSMTKTGSCEITGETTLVRPLSSTHTDVNPTCSGVDDGSITIRATGGSGNYTYHWYQLDDNDNQINKVDGLVTRSGLAPGTYYYTVEDTKARDLDGDGTVNDDETCTTDPVAVTLVAANGFAVYSDIHDVTCYTDQDGIFTISVVNGSGSYSYTWSGTGQGIVANSTAQTNLSSGVYTVVVKDTEWGCSATLTETINGPSSALSVRTTGVSDVSCNGGSDGSFNLVVSGGVAPYYYSFTSTIETTEGGDNELESAGTYAFSLDDNNFEGTAGKYLLYVQDANGCQEIIEVEIDEPDIVEATYSVSNPTSYGASDGSITINTIAGGSGTYSLNWSKRNADGSTFTDLTGSKVGSTTVTTSTRILNGLEAGVYSLSITDGNNCVSETYLITITDAGSLKVEWGVTDATCYGENGTLTALITSGTGPYSIYVNEALYESNFQGGAQIVIERPAGDYIVRITDAAGGSVTSENPDASNGAGSNVLRISQPTSPISLALKQDAVKCYGENSTEGTTVSITVSGGTLASGNYYSVVNAATGATIDNISNGQTAQVTVYSTGDYTWTATDDNGCAITQTLNVTEYPEIILSTDVTNVTCSGAMDGAIDLDVTGGSGDYSFSWMKGTDETCTTGEGSFGTVTTQVLNSLAGGYYKVTVTDIENGNCTASTIVYVSEPSALTVTENLHKDITCNGAGDGRISVVVRGGTMPYTYEWAMSDGTTIESTTNAISNLEAGIYILTVTDAKGCQEVEYYTISEPLAFEVVLTQNADCNGTNAYAEIRQQGMSSAYTGDDYSVIWRGPNSTETYTDGGYSVTNLTTGSYTVLMSKDGACTVTLNLAVPDIMSVTYDVIPQTCDGVPTGEIILYPVNGSGSYSYDWSVVSGDGSVDNANGAHQVKLAAGFYHVVVTDLGSYTDNAAQTENCTQELDIEVTSTTNFSVETSIASVSCYGATDGSINLLVSGGSGNYSYEWNGSGDGIVAGAANQSALSAGQYTVIVSDDDLGCSVTKTSLVVDGPSSALYARVVSHADNTCYGNSNGTLTAEITGGLCFSDENGNYMIYTVNGGSEQKAYETYSGSTAFRFIESNLAAGEYHYDIKDKGGCTTTLDYTIDEHAALSAEATVTDVSCYDGADGSISVTTSGFTNPIYKWYVQTGSGVSATYKEITTSENSYAASSKLAKLEAGTYAVVITRYDVDLNTDKTYNSADITTINLTDGGTETLGSDCRIVMLTDLYVSQPAAALTAAVYKEDVSGCGDTANGAIQVVATNGTAPYTITLYGTNPTREVESESGDVWFNDLSATSEYEGGVQYQVIVADANGCSAEFLSTADADEDQDGIVTLYSPETIDLSVLEYAMDYTSDPVGHVDFVVTGGVEEDAGAHQYRVTVSGSEYVKTFSLNATRSVSSDGSTVSYAYTASSTNVSIETAEDGTPFIRVSKLSEGDYTVTATDVNAMPSSCSITKEFSLSELKVSLTATQPSCETLNNGSITATVTGATGSSLTYTWYTNDDTSLDLDDASKDWTEVEDYDGRIVLSNVGEYDYKLVVSESSTGAKATAYIRLTYEKHLTLEATKTDVTCTDANDGSISITVLNDNYPSYETYTYSWTGPTTSMGNTSKVSGLAPGDYTVIVTDEEGCSVSSATYGASLSEEKSATFLAKFQIEEPDPITFSLTSEVVDCEDFNKSILINNLTGGTEPYTYTWSGPSRVTKDADGNATNLTKGGTYTLLVTDANGCSAQETYDLIEDFTVTASITNVSCKGDADAYAENNYLQKTSSNDGSITVSVSGVDVPSYNWYVLVADNEVETANDYFKALGKLRSGTVYNETTGAEETIENVDENGNFVADGTYRLLQIEQTYSTISDLYAASYFVAVDGEDCTKLAGPYTVTEPDNLLTFTATATDVATCNGDASGYITIQCSGGTAPYTINFINGDDNPQVSTRSGYYVFDGLLAATNLYRFSVTDANGCTYPANGSYVTVDVNEPSKLQLTVSRYQYAENEDADSDGTGELEFNIKGGIEANATYDDDGNKTAAGNYSYQIVLTGSEGASSYTATASPEATEEGQNFANADNTTNLTTSFENLGWEVKPGTYTLTVTDLNSTERCVVTSSFVITALELEEEVQQPSCASNEGDGMITVSVSGAVGNLSYKWEMRSSEDEDWAEIDGTENQKVINSLNVGQYRLTVTDDAVYDNTDATTTTTTAKYLQGGKVTGKNYIVKEWTLDNTKAIEFGTPTIVRPTCYGVNDGSIKPIILASSSVDASTLTYFWSGVGGFTSSDLNISGLASGNYTLTVTDADGCFSSESYTVPETPELDFSLRIDNICDPDTRTITVLDVDGNEITATGTGDKGAEYSGGVNFGGTPISTYAETNPSRYYYTWSGDLTTMFSFDPTNEESGFVASGLSEGGVFTLTIRDSKLCSVSHSTEEIPTPVTATASITNVTCYGASTGSIDVTPTGGFGNYTYAWYSGKFTSAEEVSGDAIITSQDIVKLAAGDYTLVITDNNGSTTESCTQSYYFNYEITEPTTINISGTPQDVTCYGNSDGSISLDVTGGTAPYTYTWNTGTDVVTTTADNITGLSASTYFVTVTDANGCVETSNFDVDSPKNIEFTLEETDIDCEGKNGALQILFTDETVSADDYTTITWAGPSSCTQNVTSNTSLVSGTYTITVRQSNSCYHTEQHVFTQPLSAELLSTVDNRCSGAKTGIISIQISGGSGDYTYSWSAYTDAQKSEAVENSGINNSNGAYQAGLVSGYYFVQVTDKNKTNADGERCASEFGPYYVSNGTELVVSATDGVESCVGNYDGQIYVTVSGGSGDYSYSWYGDGNGLVEGAQNQSALSRGNYQVTVTDNENGCSASASATVEGSTRALSLSLNGIVDNDCYGDSKGQITVYVVDGTPFSTTTGEGDDATTTNYFTYTWSHIDGTQQVEANDEGDYVITASDGDGSLAAGNYHLTVSDKYGCSVSEDYTVTENDKIVATTEVTDLVKVDENTGVIRITNISGGTYPYSGGTTDDKSLIVWTYLSDASGNAVNTEVESAYDSYTATNLAAGSYQFVITDAKGCSETFTATVSNNGALNAKIEVEDNVLCYGESTGSIKVTINNGQKNYTVTVNGSVYVSESEGGTIMIRNLTAGVYTVVLTDAQGATLKETLTITQPDAVFQMTVLQVDKGCYGSGSANALVEIKGGTPFDATDDANSGYYKVTAGNKSGEATYKAVTDLATTINESLKKSTAYEYLFEGLAINTTNFTVTDANGCEISEYIDMTEYEELVINDVDLTTIDCHGNNTGSIEVSITGAANPTYKWTASDLTGSAALTEDFKNEIAALNSSKLTNLVAGIYDLTVIRTNSDSDLRLASNDNSTCEVSKSYTISEPDDILVSPTVYDVTTCYGESAGEITATITGGTKPYTVTLYSTANPTEQSVQTISTSTVTFSNLAQGSYNLEVVDANNCSAVPNASDDSDLLNPLTITQPARLTIDDLSASIGCTASDGKISFSVSGGMSQKLNGTKWEEISEPEYSIVITGPGNDNNAKGSWTYGKNTDFTREEVTTTADDGTTSTSYVYSLGDLVEGTYILNVMDVNSTDVNQCQKTETIVLSNVHITADETQPTCDGINDGLISLAVSGNEGDLSYKWQMLNSDGEYEDLTETSSSASALTAGTYKVIVSDQGRATTADDGNVSYCETEQEFTLEFIHDIDVELTSVAEQCDGANDGSVLIKKITGVEDGSNLSFLWTGAGFNSSDRELSGIAPGGYTLTMTDSETGCQITKTIEVESAPEAISIQLNDTTIAANEEDADYYLHRITATITGGAGGYVWYTTGTASSLSWTAVESSATKVVRTLNADKGGDYALTIRDANNCRTSASITIAYPLSVSSDITNISCNGGTEGAIFTTVSGGSGEYSYEWTGVDTEGNAVTIAKSDEANISNLVAGIYTLTVTDKNTAIEYASIDDSKNPVETFITKTYTISQPTEMSVSGTVTHITCSGDADGQISITVEGGVAPYSYDWGTVINQTTSTVTGVNPGTYTVTVTDGNGCTAQQKFTVNEPEELDFDLDYTATDCDGKNGSIRIGHYTTTTTTDEEGNEVMSETFTADGPSGGWKWTVGEDGELTSANAQYNITWSGEGIDTDNASATFTNGEPATILSQENLTSVYSGVYRVTVTDASSGHSKCTLTKSIEFATPIKASIDNITDETCEGLLDGTVSVSVTGGKTPYTYLWTTEDGAGLSATSANQVGLKAGTYTFTVYSADYETSGCSATIEDIVVGQSMEIRVDEKISPVKCLGGNDGSIDITNIVGGSGNYICYWTGVDLSSTYGRTQTNLSRGQYTVTITDRTYGCVVTKNYTVGGSDEALTVDVTNITNIKCKDDTDPDGDGNRGSITVEAKGGTGPYSYAWSGNGTDLGTSNTITNLRAGDYMVTVTDYMGCQETSEVITITEPQYTLTASVDDDDIVPVTITGESTGEITVHITGGTGSYNYSWYKYSETDGYTIISPPEANTSHATELAAGYYQVVVEDENGCQASVSDIYVSEPNAILSLIAYGTNVKPCQGDDNGEISANVTGGTIPYTLTVTDGEGNVKGSNYNNQSINVKGLSAGVYTVEVQDANGIIKSQSITILEPLALSLTKTRGTDNSCYGDELGSFQLTVDGGTQISVDDETTGTSTTSTLGNYQLTVSGPNSYNNVTNPTAGATVDFNNLAAGTYYITLIDGGTSSTSETEPDNSYDKSNDCYVVDTIVINQPDAYVALSKVSTDANFYACADEEVELKLIVDADWDISTTPLYVVIRHNDLEDDETTYEVTKSPYTFTVTDATTASYQIVNIYTSDATCAQGTWDTEREFVEIRPRPTSYIHGSDEICLGGSIDATIDLTPSSSSTWKLVVSDGTIDESLTINSSPYTYTYTPRSAGDVTLSIISLSDENCSALADDMTGEANITVNSLPQVTLTGSKSICEGESADLVFTVTGGTPPYTITYYYYDENTGNQIANTISAKTGEQNEDGAYVITQSVSPTETTDYYVNGIVDSKNCFPDESTAYEDVATIYVKAKASRPSSISGDDVVCQGSAGHVYSTPTVADATGYQWNVPDGATIITGQGSNSISVNFDNTFEGGNIGVQALNDCNESQELTMLITANFLPAFDDTDETARTIVSENGTKFCQGQTNIYLSIPQISYASEYEWDLPTGMSIVNGSGTSSIAVQVEEYVTPLNGSIRVRGKNSCGNGEWSDELEITISKLPSVNAGNDRTYCPATDETSLITLTGTTDNSSSITETWTVVAGGSTFSSGERTATGNSVTVLPTSLTQNRNAFLYTVYNETTGCEASDTIVITNLDVNVYASPATTLICDGTAEISGSSVPPSVTGITYSGLWTVESTRESGVNITDASSARTYISNLSKGETTLRWTIMANTCPTYAEFTVSNNEPDYPVIEVAYNDGTDKTSTIYDGVAHDYNITYDETYYAYRIVVCSPDVTLKGFHYIDPTDTSKGNSDAIFGENQVLEWEQVTGGGALSGSSTDTELTLTGLTWGDNVIRYVARNGNCSKSVTLDLYYGKVNLNAGIDGSTCDGTFQLNASTTDIPEGAESKWYNYDPTSEDWTITGEGEFDNAWSSTATVSNIAHGSQTFWWVVDVEGCLSSDYVTIVNNQVDVAKVEEKNVIACDGGEYDLKINKNVNVEYETGRWSIIEGYGEFGHYIYGDDGSETWVVSPEYYHTSDADTYTKVRNVARGRNIFLWTIASVEGGCSSSDTVVVYNNSIDVDAGNDTSICTTTVQLHANTRNYSNSYWSAVSGSSFNLDEDDLSNPDARVGGISAGKNYYVWTVYNNGCYSTDTVVVTNDTPQLADGQASSISGSTITLVPSSKTIDSSDTSNATTITGATVKTGYGVGHWELYRGGGTIESPYSVTTRVTDLDLGNSYFKWIIENNNCTASGIYTVINGSTTDAEAGSNVYDLCTDSYTLSGNGPFNGIGQWKVVLGTGEFADSYSATTTVSGLAEGHNAFEWSITYNSRVSRDTVHIWNMSVTDAYAGVDRTGDQALCGDSITLQGGNVSANSYSFTKIDSETGLSTATYVSTTHEWSLLSGGGSFYFNESSEEVMIDEDGNATLDEEKAVRTIFYTAEGSVDSDVYATYLEEEQLYAKYSRNPAAVGLKQGTNKFLYTVTNGICSSVDTFTVFNDRADDAWACGLGNTCDTLYTCDGTITLNPNSPSYGTGEWKISSGGSAKFSGNYAYDLAQGPNTLIWEISTTKGGDCTTRDYVVVQNNSPTEADAGSDDPLTVCGSESVLSGNKPTYYSYAYWELVEGSGQFITKDGDGEDVYTYLFTNDSKVVAETIDGETVYVHYKSDGDVNFYYYPATETTTDSYVSAAGAELTAVTETKTGTYTESGVTSSVTYETIVLYYTDGTVYAQQERNTDATLSAATTGLLTDRVTLYRGDGTDNQNVSVSGLAFGNNRFRWVIVNGEGEHTCTSTDETILNNIFIQSVAGSVAPLCADSVRLTANNPSPGVGLWSIAAGRGRGSFDDSSDPHTYVRNLGSGENVLVWTVNYLECPSTDTVVVLNVRPTDAYITSSYQNLCETNETILTAGALATFDASTNMVEYGEWQIAEGAGNIISPNSSTTRVTDIPFNTGGNRFNWIVRRTYNSSTTCVSMTDVTVYYNKIEADAGDDDLVCSDSYVLKATSASPGTGEWSIIGASSSGIFENTADPTTSISGLANGSNILRWTTTYNGCSDYDEVTIYNGNPSVPNAGGNDEICQATGDHVDEYTLSAAVPEIGIGHWVTMGGSAEWDEDETPYLDSNWLREQADKDGWTAEQRQYIDFDDEETSTWYASDTNEKAKAYDSSIFNPTATLTIGKGKNTYRWLVENRNAVPIWEDDAYSIQIFTCTLSDDVVITNLNPSEPEAGDDRALCTDSYELNATAPTYGTGRWTIDGSGGGTIADPTSAKTNVTNLAYGTTTFKWTVSVDGMCAKSDYVTLKNMAASTSDAGPDADVCVTEYALNANTPVIGTGHWEVGSGNYSVITGTTDDGTTVVNESFEDIYDPQTTVTNFIFGDNIFYWVIENVEEFNGTTYKCTSTDSVVLNYQIPDQAVAGANQTICLDYTVMNANTPVYGTGVWSLLQGEGTIADSTNAKTTITGLAYGENIFRWTISYLGCTTDSDVVIYSQTADPYAGENDVTYTDTYQLNAGNPGRLSGYWTVLGNADKTAYGGTTIVFEDSTKYNTYVSGLSRGVNTFRWTIKTDDCIVYDEVSITYKIVPNASFSADYIEGCYPLTVHFSDQSENASSYNWDFGDGTTSTLRSPSHTFQLSGTYEVRLSIPGPDGLSSDTSVYITVYDHPTASFDAQPQLVYLPDDAVHFINRSVGATSFLWNFGDGNTSTEKNPLYTYSNEGFYTVNLQVWNDHGCSSDTTKESFIEARSGGFIVFPNTFAPRAEATGISTTYSVNATFRPQYQDVETFTLQIFNRWGQKVFETNDISTGWDGHFNGSVAAAGVYTWVAKGKFVSGKQYTKSGQVLLLR